MSEKSATNVRPFQVPPLVKTMTIEAVRLVEKEGGKSGHFVRPGEPAHG